ncbi:hypothetical protein [Nocardia brevicatena]|uniref:hypothetical protein n=1 Tax=Nocardia brevicatena TaxID=37327 RepID=UPI0003114905|nr:hypothetical protein [Nocardia brevicatena]
MAYRAEPGDDEDIGMINHSAVVAKVGPDGILVDFGLGTLTTARPEIAEFDPRFGPYEIYTTDRPDGRFLTSVTDSEMPAPQWPYSPDEAADGAR